MTINTSWAKILFDKREQYNFHGKLLTLGRQHVEIKSEAVKNFFKNAPDNVEVIAPELLFNSLGFRECHSMDYSVKDGATIIHNLNEEVPEWLKNQYDFVIDGGTMEHCFDVRAVLVNIVEMLKIGGTIIHLNPTQGHCNHAFYNFQPTLFYSFYGANHFSEMECNIVELLSKAGTKFRVISTKNVNNLAFTTSNDCSILFKAVKTNSNPIKIPNQEFYHKIFKEKEKVGGAMIDDSLYQEIVGRVPGNNYDNIINNSYIVDLDQQ